MSINQLIAQGSLPGQQFLGNAINRVGDTVQRNRLLKLQKDERALDRQREDDRFNQTMDLNRGKLESQQQQAMRKAQMEFEKGAVTALATIDDPRQLMAGLEKFRADAASQGLSTANFDENIALGRAGRFDEVMQDVRLSARAVGGKQQESKSFDRETKLRDAFVKQSKDFADQNAAFGRIQASANDPSAAGDLALIFNYMKLLDPGSTVREGEFANAQNSGGVDSRVRSLYNQVMSGQRLDGKQRADFFDRSKRLYSEADAQHSKRESQYLGLAERNNLNPENVIINLRTANPDADVNLDGSTITGRKELNGKTYIKIGNDWFEE